MKDIKKGDTIYDVQSKELHVVIEEPNEQGYIKVKYESLVRHNIEGGENIIHKSEIDDIHLKKL